MENFRNWGDFFPATPYNNRCFVTKYETGQSTHRAKYETGQSHDPGALPWKKSSGRSRELGGG